MLNKAKIKEYDIDVQYLERTEPSWSFEGEFYSVLVLEIKLFSLYQKHIYIYFAPTFMFTLTSWVSFLLPPTSYPARCLEYSKPTTFLNMKQTFTAFILTHRTTLLITTFLCQIGIFTTAINGTPNQSKGIII